MDVGGYFRFLMDASGYLILVEFSRILRLVESGGFFKYRVDIGRNLRLIDLSGFSKFWLRVRVVYYRMFLFIVKGSK